MATEYAYLRGLLGDGMAALEELFEHGFAHSPQGGKELLALSARFASAGLDRGELLLGSLARSLEESRFRLHYPWEEAALEYCALRDYLHRCLRRLNYLEAEASLTEDLGVSPQTPPAF